MLASVCVLMSTFHLDYLTEDVGKKVVLLEEGYVAIALTAGISNQTPVNRQERLKRHPWL